MPRSDDDLSLSENVPSRKRPHSPSDSLAFTQKANQRLQIITGKEEAFAELGDFESLYEGLATHVRNHVNPFTRPNQIPTEVADWSKLFAEPSWPLHIDVGCGYGRFVLIRAKRLAGSSSTVAMPGSSKANVVGLEIRKKLVERAQAWRDRLSLTNCHFICANVTISWKSLFHNYPGPIELVSIQFPDPQFKRKHHKRHLVQPQFVREVAETLTSGAQIFLQGDVPQAVRWMRDSFDRYGEGRFRLAPESMGKPASKPWGSSNDAHVLGPLNDEWQTPSDESEDMDRDSALRPLVWSEEPEAGWLQYNPLDQPTEREVYVGNAGVTIYRVMIERTDL